MIKNQGLFKRVAEGFKKANNARKLYTNSIYPYPYRYFNETVFPSRYMYRETFTPAPWDKSHAVKAKWMFRVFWTHWWYMAFTHPEVITGHFHPPDPSLWTDEELGIPPLEEGPYEDWKKSKMEE